MRVWVTHGRTESGDDIGALVWDHKPTEAEYLAEYRHDWPEEFEAFGDDGGLSVTVSFAGGVRTRA